MPPATPRVPIPKLRTGSVVDDFSNFLKWQDYRGQESSRRHDSQGGKHISFDDTVMDRGGQAPMYSARPHPRLATPLDQKQQDGGAVDIDNMGPSPTMDDPLLVDEKEWSNVMNSTLALLMFVFVIAVMYCCYTLIAPYKHGIGWGILLSIVFHKSGESLFAHGRARKSRRDECLENMKMRRREMKTVLAKLLSSRRGGENRPIRGCPATKESPRGNCGDATFRSSEASQMERVTGFGFIISYVSWILITFLARIVSVGVFLEYALLEVADTLGLKKIHFIPDVEKQYTIFHRMFLCGLTYLVLGGTVLAVGGPIGFLILHILVAFSLVGFILPYVSVEMFMPAALRLVRFVVLGGMTVLLAFSFYRDVGNVTETVTSGASYILGDNGHMVGEFFISMESRVLEDIARSFNASNVTKTAHDIRTALDPLLVQWYGSEDGEVRVLNWTEQINVIISSFYSTTDMEEEGVHISKREKKRRARKARQARQLRQVNPTSGSSQLQIVAVSDENDSDDDDGATRSSSSSPRSGDDDWDLQLTTNPSTTTPAIATTMTAGDPSSQSPPTVTTTASTPKSPGILSTAQTLMGSLGSKLRPVLGVLMPLFSGLFSNIMRLFDSIYEFVLFTCVYRFCQAQPDSVLYYTTRKALSTVDPWTAPARARALEEDIILQFLTLLQSFWHISWYHFSVTYVCLELCAVPLPFLLGIIAVLMALFPLLTRFVSPVFVALYVLLVNGLFLSGTISLLLGTICMVIAVLCMFVQTWHRYVMMGALCVVVFAGTDSPNYYDLFRWMVLLTGVAVLQNDEWLLTVRRSTNTRGARKTAAATSAAAASSPASPGAKNKRTNNSNSNSKDSIDLVDSNTSEGSSCFDSNSVGGLIGGEGGELPTFIVGTCVVLGLVTYGLPGVMIGPLLFIVAKATYDNIGWDIPADIIAATDAALRGGDPAALYEAVSMYTGNSLGTANNNNPATSSPTTASSPSSKDDSILPKSVSRPSSNVLLQSHTGSSTLLRTAVWRALAQQRAAGRKASPFQSPMASHQVSSTDVRSPIPNDPHARPHSPLDLDRSGTTPTTPASPAGSRSSSSDIGVHMSQTGGKSTRK